LAGVASEQGCPPKPPVNTVTNFPGILFIVNTDNFDLTVPGTLENLNKIKALVDQCDNLRVEIEGHASSEGDPKRNQELSDMRAARVKSWLVEQGVDSNKVSRTIGYGSSKPLVPEPEAPKATKGKGKKAAPKGPTPEQIEAARKQNRRIAVRVVETCK
jgi:outer membrane protein OmpA-like peptidoglycan-associated protein